MELALDINSGIKSILENISDLQEKFLETDFFKVLNSGLDLGIKFIMPDIIENQIIDIKDAILEGGLKNGVNQLVENIKNFGKSGLGIVTGTFENISQIQTAVKKGGIIDTISGLLDKAINFANKNGSISDSIKNILESGKNSILSIINNNISESLDNQIKYVEKVNEYNEKWEKCFENKDFDGMEKAYENLKKYIEKCIPLEEVLTNARKNENIHLKIKQNKGNFDITLEELELAGKL